MKRKILIPFDYHEEPEEVDYKKLYENLKKELEESKSKIKSDKPTISGNSNIQISAGQNVNITITDGDKFTDSVNMGGEQ